MMNRKEQVIQALYPYYGLGFRVNLLNVPMIQIQGEWVPDINFNTVEEVMALSVPLKASPLTGSEIRFLRRHLGLSLDEMASKLGVTKQGISKWEKNGDRSTNMSPATEKLFRMIVLDLKGVSAEVFKKSFDLLFEKKRSASDEYELDVKRPIRPARQLRALLSA